MMAYGDQESNRILISKGVCNVDHKHALDRNKVCLIVSPRSLCKLGWP